MNIHALWCHPRSVSTAFERIMRARGDLNVLHEPFMYHYYLTRTQSRFPDFNPDPTHPTSFGEIRTMIMVRALDKPVFFKDMAYYVVEDLPDFPDFMASMSHAFLVRDPVQAAVSYHAHDPEFDRVELGVEAQFRLFEILQKAGQQPLVLTADQLRSNPEETLRRYWEHAGLSFAPHAFEWDEKVPESWEPVAQWHSAVLQSRAIKPLETTRDYHAELKALGAPFVDYEKHHRPFYEALRDVANAQAHQK